MTDPQLQALAHRADAATAAFVAEIRRLRSALQALADACPTCRGTGWVRHSVLRGSGMDWEEGACGRCRDAREVLG